MATDFRLKETLPEITEALVATYTDYSRTNHLGHKPLPSREVIADILGDLIDVLYPGYARRQNLHMGNVEYHVGDLIDGLHDKLTQQFTRALRHEHDCHAPPAPVLQDSDRRFTCSRATASSTRSTWSVARIFWRRLLSCPRSPRCGA